MIAVGLVFQTNFQWFYLSGATIAFQRAESQFFFLVGFSEEKLQWRGWGGGEEQDASASLRNQVDRADQINQGDQADKINQVD